VQQGRRRGERLIRELADELRDARLAAGITQRDVAAAVGLSGSSLSRIERGRQPMPGLVVAAAMARIVGLDLSVRCFPAAGRLRDAAHVALVRRFLAQLHHAVVRTIEAPIPLDRDQRAWDVLLSMGPVTIGVAAETRLRDIQALLRREQAKQRDAGVTHLLLVVADTHANRQAMREARDLLTVSGLIGPRAVMSALRHGRDPGSSGWVLI
jgi:transcriptional regulator with XRE-family HTH domain